MKKTVLSLVFGAMAMFAMTSCHQSQPAEVEEATTDTSIVYVTRDITPEALVKIYEALGRKAEGRVAVKISTGESAKTGYLRPDFIKPLLDAVNGTIVECNTAYAGTRNTTESHWKAIKERGFMDVANVDIMDAEGNMNIPVMDTTHLKYNIVGSHLANYDFMINLAHYKGHQMGGFGGVLKNASIGVASAAGKAYIHTAGVTSDVNELWNHVDDQDGFLESMAAAAQAVHNYFGEGERILYINVMNNMSIDCDCNANPAAPALQDYGILASLDPVALDQACYDIVVNIPVDENNNNKPLLERIEKQHGTHTIEWAEKIGLGSRQYKLVSIDK